MQRLARIDEAQAPQKTAKLLSTVKAQMGSDQREAVVRTLLSGGCKSWHSMTHPWRP